MSWISIVLISYLLGNISPSYFIGKKFKNLDIREHGSGNAGTTNTLRVLGAKYALIVFVIDFLKGLIATQIGYKAGGLEFALIAAVAVVFGHVFPVLLKFKGGKGVATSVGALLGLFPIYGLIALLLAIALIMKTRYVSLGSIVGMSTLPFILYSARQPRESIITSIILAGFIIFTHRENIKRLINKTERKLGEKTK